MEHSAESKPALVWHMATLLNMETFQDKNLERNTQTRGYMDYPLLRLVLLSLQAAMTAPILLKYVKTSLVDSLAFCRSISNS